MTDGTPQNPLTELRDALRDFAALRHWDQFHTPRNLAVALSVEAAELLEHFQWVQDAEVTAFDDAKREQIGEEIADVLLYLVRLADKLGLDPVDVAQRKLALNAAKYPVHLSKGSSKKYTEL